MTARRLSRFAGLAPRIAPHLLPENYAQTAQNCKLWSGEIRSWKNPLLLENLLTYSEDLATAPWSSSNVTRVTGGYIAPDGTATGDSCIEDTTATSLHRFYGYVTTDATKPCTLSFYVKAAGRDKFGLYIHDQATTSYFAALFDLASGVVTYTNAIGSGVLLGSTIEPLANSWYRVSISGIPGAGTYIMIQLRLHDASDNQTYTGGGVYGLRVWGAQLTKSAAPSNLLLYSEQFDNAVWSSGGTLSVTANTTTAPDGTTTADKTIESANTYSWSLSQAMNITSGQNYTISAYVKAAERTHCILSLYSGFTAYPSRIFNLTNGESTSWAAFAAPNAYGSVDLGNGWFRCWITATATSTVNGYQYISNSNGTSNTYLGTAGYGLYLWGAQVNKGNLLPYEKTESALSGYLATAATAFTFTGINTIYRFGQDVISDTQYWFRFTGNVDVVRGPIAGDTSERTYYTGVGVPKVTDSTLAVTGGSAAYPINAYTLGIPIPVAAPTATPGGSGSGAAVSRAYVYTYVSGWGEEGMPSVASNIASVQPGQTVTVSGMSTGPSGSYNIVSKRIYRAITGFAATEYQFVAEIAVATTSYVDSLTDTQLGGVIPSEAYAQPPTDMAGLVGMPNGILAGFSKNEVCLCEAYKPYAWPNAYRQTVDYSIVGLGVFGTNLVVLTKGVPYIGTGSDPSSITLTKLGDVQACVSKRSIANLGYGVAYASPDGLVIVDGAGLRVVTDSWMKRDEWQNLKPESIHGYAWEGRYIGFYNTETVSGGFILDPREPDSTLTYISTYAACAYVDPQIDALFYIEDGQMKKWDAGNTYMTSTWKSKAFQESKLVNYGAARVVAGEYPVTAKFYGDGILKHTQTVSDRKPFRLPSGFLQGKTEIEVSGANVNVKYIDIAETMVELESLAA